MTSQPDTAALPPETDLGAMVKAILAEAHSPRAGIDPWLKLAANLGVIHDTGQRLKVALEQREGVMEEMAKALEAAREAMAFTILAGGAALALADKSAVTRKVGGAELKARQALDKYKAARHV